MSSKTYLSPNQEIRATAPVDPDATPVITPAIALAALGIAPLPEETNSTPGVHIAVMPAHVVR